MKKFITIFFLLAVFVVNGQNPDLNKWIRENLPSSQKSKISQYDDMKQTGLNLKEQGDKLMQQAESAKDEAAGLKGRKKRKKLKEAEELEDKALDKLLSASVQLIKAYKGYYAIYKEDLTGKKAALPSSLASTVENSLSAAANYYSKAMSTGKQGQNSKDKRQKYDYFSNSVDLLKKSVNELLMAYEAIYDKESQKPKTSLVVVVPTENGNEVKKTVMDGNKPKSNQVNTGNVEEFGSSSITAASKTQPAETTSGVNNSLTKTKYVNQGNKPAQPKQNSTAKQNHTYRNVYFRIQVAASISPLSPYKLKNIYSGSVLTEFDPYDQMYKYVTKEKFASYEEAYYFKKMMRVKGAFIVAYKNGKRVRNINEIVDPSLPQKLAKGSY